MLMIFIFWIVFIPLKQKANLKHRKKQVQFNQYQKSEKLAFIIYADLECLIEDIDACKNNPENSFVTKVGEHIPSGFSMCTSSSFKSIEIKHDVDRGKDYMKTFCESLRGNAMEIIKF